MDKRYAVKFSIVFIIILLLTALLGFYMRDKSGMSALFDMNFVQREDISYVHISSSNDSKTYRSTIEKDIDDVYLILLSMETKTAKNFERTENYYQVILGSTNNFSRIAYTFYDNGFVEIKDQVSAMGSEKIVILEDSAPLSNLISIFEQGIKE